MTVSEVLRLMMENWGYTCSHIEQGTYHDFAYSKEQYGPDNFRQSTCVISFRREDAEVKVRIKGVHQQ